MHLLHRQSKPIQLMQRVTICQDSTHLPLEPYVSCKIFEQIIYNHQQQQLHLQYSQHPSPPVKLSGLNVSKSHATQADKHHGSDVQSVPASLRYRAWKLWTGSCRLSKYHSPNSESTRSTLFNRGSTLQIIVQISNGASTQVSEHEQDTSTHPNIN